MITQPCPTVECAAHVMQTKKLKSFVNLRCYKRLRSFVLFHSQTISAILKHLVENKTCLALISFSFICFVYILWSFYKMVELDLLTKGASAQDNRMANSIAVGGFDKTDNAVLFSLLSKADSI